MTHSREMCQAVDLENVFWGGSIAFCGDVLTRTALTNFSSIYVMSWGTSWLDEAGLLYFLPS